MQLNHESNRYEQTQEQQETGVRILHPSQSVRSSELIEAGGKQFGKASNVREEILRNANENFSLAQRHLVEGIDWMDITGMVDIKMQERHAKLKRLISDVLESVEGLRKVYVHPSQM